MRGLTVGVEEIGVGALAEVEFGALRPPFDGRDMQRVEAVRRIGRGDGRQRHLAQVLRLELDIV